jgi:hypothetical protein
MPVNIFNFIRPNQTNHLFTANVLRNDKILYFNTTKILHNNVYSKIPNFELVTNSTTTKILIKNDSTTKISKRNP